MRASRPSAELEAMAGSRNIWFPAGPSADTNSLNSYQIPQGAKLLVADAAHNDEVFRPAKRSVFFAMLDDARGQRFTNSRQRFQFVRGRGVDVDWFWNGHAGR